MEDTKAVVVEQPKEEVKDFDPGFVYQPQQPQPITDFPELQEMVKKGLEDGTIVIQGAVEEPKILTMGIDVVDRPGDYVTAPEPDVTFLPDSDHLIYEGKSYSIDAFKDHFPDLSAVADNHPSLGNAAKADFGTEFPQKPTKGDLYLRTDYLPSKQFKWNGAKWIEVDKSITDALAYNEQYIQHLVEKLSSGEYELDDLTDTEQSQVAEYLKNSTK
jgi:hypothetical protein